MSFRIIIFALLLPLNLMAMPTETHHQDDTQFFTTYTWQSPQSEAETLILLSGPNDHWNSDAAWWVSFAPLLQSQFNVIAIERPSMGYGNESPTLGYIAFAQQVAQVLNTQKLNKINIVAFASSNMTVLQLLAKQPELTLGNVLLIDPDVLTDFSIARYKSDAQPFKDNLEKYAEYILAGKYTPRVMQKAEIELAHIKQLQPQLSEEQKSWLNTIVNNREKLPNQVNLFKEIAMYGEDLDQAKQLTWPDNINLTIIDTDFEQNYIDNLSAQIKKAEGNEEEIAKYQEAITGLQQWRNDARQHYIEITSGDDKRRLVEVQEAEHLYQVLAPEKLLELLAR